MTWRSVAVFGLYIGAVVTLAVTKVLDPHVTVGALAALGGWVGRSVFGVVQGKTGTSTPPPAGPPAA